MTEAAWIVFAFVLGLTLRQLGLPPLVGYLAAGFALNAVSTYTGQRLDGGVALEHIAHLGVMLLLFTVGLKLRLRSIIQTEVMGSSLAHGALTCLVLTPVFHLFGVDWGSALFLAVALSFSSTVVAAKVLEVKRELRAFHGRVAIGILVVQDLVALAVLSLAGGHAPSLLAFLVLALPFARPIIHRLVDVSGHDELLIVFGLLLALVVGGLGFGSVGLSPELGALLLGALLANHSRAQELAKALWGIKEVFLIGFFIHIGMSELPTVEALGMALLLVLLLPLKAVLFFFLLLRFKLRARSAFLASLSLASYSEFGLIVANLVLPDWTVVLALTVAISFVIAAPLNRLSQTLYERYEAVLVRYELDERHRDDQPVSLGLAEVLVIGMGRLGAAAYDYLRGDERVVGLDTDPGKVQRHLQEGRRVLYADAEDPAFWQSLHTDNLKAVILSMNDAVSKVNVTRHLRKRGFDGVIVTSCLYDDEAKNIKDAGADNAFLVYSDAGIGLAEHVRQALYGDAPQEAQA
ncbi:MAG: cation:proton antiporter [Gammaproteobacteria bacterium]|nr:cation:proton antiporter [Gammaproteobacteria bacterium]